MNNKYQFVSLVILIFLNLDLSAQNLEMKRNNNYIDIEYVPTLEIQKRINLQSKLSKDINVILQKNNDSLYDIYIYNQNNDTLSIYIQDNSVLLIQEAKNQNGKWKPIEYWLYSKCANSYHHYKLKPKGILKTNSKIYKGSFKTEIRFKLLNNNNVYYSNTIIGFVDLSQFDLPNNIAKNGAYRSVKHIGGLNLLKKVVFLEPNGLKEYAKKQKDYLDKIKAKKENKQKK